MFSLSLVKLVLFEAIPKKINIIPGGIYLEEGLIFGGFLCFEFGGLTCIFRRAYFQHFTVFETYSHVGLASGISRLSNGVNKLATDTKVTKLDTSLKIKENVGRFHIW